MTKLHWNCYFVVDPICSDNQIYLFIDSVYKLCKSCFKWELPIYSILAHGINAEILFTLDLAGLRTAKFARSTHISFFWLFYSTQTESKSRKCPSTLTKLIFPCNEKNYFTKQWIVCLHSWFHWFRDSD